MCVVFKRKRREPREDMRRGAGTYTWHSRSACRRTLRFPRDHHAHRYSAWTLLSESLPPSDFRRQLILCLRAYWTTRPLNAVLWFVFQVSTRGDRHGAFVLCVCITRCKHEACVFLCPDGTIPTDLYQFKISRIRDRWQRVQDNLAVDPLYDTTTRSAAPQ